MGGCKGGRGNATPNKGNRVFCPCTTHPPQARTHSTPPERPSGRLRGTVEAAGRCDEGRGRNSRHHRHCLFAICLESLGMYGRCVRCSYQCSFMLLVLQTLVDTSEVVVANPVLAKLTEAAWWMSSLILLPPRGGGCVPRLTTTVLVMLMPLKPLGSKMRLRLQSSCSASTSCLLGAGPYVDFVTSFADCLEERTGNAFLRHYRCSGTTYPLVILD